MSKKLIKSSVYLCGMMGAGKTTIGKLIAEHYQVSFSDLDHWIEKRENSSISRIFKERGETYFRTLERNLIIDQTPLSSGVLALGGGSLQDQQVVDHLKHSGTLVFIHSPVEQLYDRLKKSKHRPMIASEDEKTLKTRLSSLLTKRLPFYEQAHCTIINSSTPEKAARQIIHYLDQQNA